MKKLIIAILLTLSCSTQLFIPKSKNGESFYAESYNSGMQTINQTGWILCKIDTIKQFKDRPLYLFHYTQ